MVAVTEACPGSQGWNGDPTSYGWNGREFALGLTRHTFVSGGGVIVDNELSHLPLAKPGPDALS